VVKYQHGISAYQGLNLLGKINTNQSDLQGILAFYKLVEEIEGHIVLGKQ
jgi:hypothetical protein